MIIRPCPRWWRRGAGQRCSPAARATGLAAPNASLAGLPVEYFRQQMADFRSGARGTSMPGRAPTRLMLATARAITDEEVEAAAVYFASIRPRRAIRVVEAEQVPRTQVTGWYLV